MASRRTEDGGGSGPNSGPLSEIIEYVDALDTDAVLSIVRSSNVRILKPQDWPGLSKRLIGIAMSIRQARRVSRLREPRKFEREYVKKLRARAESLLETIKVTNERPGLAITLAMVAETLPEDAPDEIGDPMDLQALCGGVKLGDFLRLTYDAGEPQKSEFELLIAMTGLVLGKMAYFCKQSETLLEPADKKGPRADLIEFLMVHLLVQWYESATGTRASYTTDNYRDSERRGPFIDFVRAFHQATLPEEPPIPPERVRDRLRAVRAGIARD